MTFKEFAFKTSQFLLGLVGALALVLFIALFAKTVFRVFMFGWNVW